MNARSRRPALLRRSMMEEFNGVGPLENSVRVRVIAGAKLASARRRRLDSLVVRQEMLRGAQQRNGMRQLRQGLGITTHKSGATNSACHPVPALRSGETAHPW